MSKEIDAFRDLAIQFRGLEPIHVTVLLAYCQRLEKGLVTLTKSWQGDAVPNKDLNEATTLGGEIMEHDAKKTEGA